ncbi:hypothetical protein [Nitrosococcus watsonii]|uniref:Calcineurin-like phosphoesterase domain-containing protein n=1 Tax=Nitrosococcus watsoni (strain C-113) TaxID=105559 RepID=D8K5Q6_NITWC|nr:hypothetical protein [Nitrosococcus watsonii]ADJ28233.1 conserved hypothetical protein [Nitrosococcus watsonii C-113]
MFQGQKLARSKSARTFKGPVAWLFGRQLIAGLKWIGMYAFFGDKLDSRDWMRPDVITRHGEAPEEEAFWFDYLADSGDGQCATYNIAYLCQHDLWLPNENPSPDIAQESKTVSLIGDAGNVFKLPRGEFLFVGGDTSYHIADYATLADRFQQPFNWAYEDIFGPETRPETRRPIYGIPGNHDYYDALDGFNRQFLKPFNQEHEQDTEGAGPQLSLKGFERLQEASYVALKLPYGWWFWGLDTQAGKIDRRQAAFFLSLCNPEVSEATAENKAARKAPDKLIVATPEPTTQFGRWAREEEAIVETFKKLELAPSFLKSNAGNLPPSQCRLDISGDIHHYARYWGKGAVDKSDHTRTNYASVVAGGGGAFLHPSHTDVEEVAENQLYPPRTVSHRLMTRRLLMPWNIFQGGYIWLAGGLMALIIYFAAVIPESSWSIFKLMPNGLRPLQNDGDSLLSRIQGALAIEWGNSTSEYYWDLIYALLLLILLSISALRTKRFFEAAMDRDRKAWAWAHYRFIGFHLALFAPMGVFMYGWNPSGHPHSFLASVLVLLFLLASLVSLVISRRYDNLLFERAKSHQIIKGDYTPLWILMLFAAVSACHGLWHYGRYPVAVVFADILTILTLLLTLGGLIFFAVVAGGSLHERAGKLWFAALGCWHAVLQISVPVLLVIYSSWITIFIVVSSVILATLLTAWMMTRDSLMNENRLQQEKLGRQLLIIWLLVGVSAMLIASWGGEAVEVTWSRLAAAFLVGGILSCVWFGWYLVVALAFNGHNNEAGGGARTQTYRHFIRFKLTPKKLTGYVIGIDQPVESFPKDKEMPKFRLVDVFTIGL